VKRVIIFFIISALIWPLFSIGATTQEEIDARNKQIEEIQKQIDAYQRQIEENSSKARTLAVEIDRLNAQISKVQLEIKSLGIAISQTNLEIGDTQSKIQIAQNKLGLHKEALAKYVRILYELDRENLTKVLLGNAKLSDFFNNLKNLGDIQDNLQATISGIKNLKADLEQKESDLEDKKSELEQLKGLQQAEKKNLDLTKSEKNTLLKETKGQETKFQQLVKQSQQDIARIRDQISYLIQNGVTVEEAIKFGQLAALRVGIRPAFLIAILEVESGLGKNVGTGNWLEDMYKCYLELKKPSRAEAEKAAFFEIVTKLGLNPDAVKVSREPNYGCGGALGPAQFLPTTWLAYEEEVTRLTGHRPPNPWNIEDAFMASAAKLAKAGATAQTRAAEVAAAKAYLSGKSNCSSRICNYYASAVLDKAAVIGQSLQ
jgi:peptidoglycan hydrolase CwlO-like protein